MVTDTSNIHADDAIDAMRLCVASYATHAGRGWAARTRDDGHELSECPHKNRSVGKEFGTPSYASSWCFSRKFVVIEDALQHLIDLTVQCL